MFNFKVWIGKIEEENFTGDMAGLKSSEVKTPKEILAIETVDKSEENGENKLKRMAKQHYDKMRYAKKREQEREKEREQKREYYQEHKEERLGYQTKYYQEHKEEKLKYYAENKTERLEYQRNYDKKHKQRKKEYRKLKAHYKKYANRMWELFQKNEIFHFLSHINGWCNWHRSSHEYCWENVSQQCSRCDIPLFKLKLRPYEINALHCISCTQVMCILCGLCIQDHDYYLHFYLNGLFSDMLVDGLKEKAKMCPYRTYLGVKNQKENFPCEICSNEEIKEKRKEFVKIVGIKYRNFLNEKTFEITTICTNPGKEILVCPYTDLGVQSTICLRDAVRKLSKKINAGLTGKSPEYMFLSSKFSDTVTHRTTFDHMCDLKKHLHLHEDRRVDIHIVELTLAEAYTTKNDLKIIDILLKTSIEKYEQVSKIKAIIPAECLGFNYHHKHESPRDAWLAVVDPKLITTPVTIYPERKFIDDPAINSMMNKIKEEKKNVYMVIHTHEGLLENPVEYFEELPLYPKWITKSKLLFTLTVKDILMEESKLVQKSLISAEFMYSKNHPNYFMNLANSNICSCDCCLPHPCAIRQSHTKPVNGCSLPMIQSPLQAVASSKDSDLELWEEMFEFAWEKLHSSDNIDTTPSSESHSSESSDDSEHDDKHTEVETDNCSNDSWPDY